MSECVRVCAPEPMRVRAGVRAHGFDKRKIIVMATWPRGLVKRP